MDIVIGGGLAGLLTAYCTGAVVVSRDVGGQVGSPFPLGPRILKASDETWKLAKELEFEEGPQSFSVGYLDHTGLYNRPPDRFRETYYFKTRDSHNPPPSAMSDGESCIVGWDMNKICLVGKLLKRVSIIRQNVIALNRHGLHAELWHLPYNKIYSTIPLPTLFKIINIEQDVETRAIGTYFVKVPYDMFPSETAFELSLFDYVYVSNPLVPYHRITRSSSREHGAEPEYFVLEIREDRFDSSQWQTYQNIFIPNCQLLNKLGLTGIIGNGVQIELVGRFAQWDHGVRLHDILRRFGYAEQMGNKRE